MTSSVEVPDLATMRDWPTKRVLALRDRLLRCVDCLEHTDLQSPDEVAALDATRIHFKDDPRWSALYAQVGEVLSTREHVPSSQVRAAARRERAKRR